MRLRLVLRLTAAAASAASGAVCLGVIGLLPAAGASATRAAAARPARVERRLAAMGTLLSLSIEAPDRPRALEASEAAVRRIEAAETLLSTWRRGGALDRLDRARPGEDVEIGGEAARVLDRVFALSRQTDGAFDPTVLPLVRTWDLRGSGRVPTSEELARARAATGPSRFRWDVARGTAARLSADAGIDEGAWGKGYALDRAAEALAKFGVSRATLDLGGQVTVLDAAWLSVADPRDRGRGAAEVLVQRASLSTSGNSERGKTVGTARVGHLLDPATGRPASDFGSATVLAPEGVVADALSTALFVAGPERGLSLSDRLRRDGIDHEVLYLVVDGARVKAVASPGLRYRLLSEE